MSIPNTEPSSKRVLEPIERISEVLFGLVAIHGGVGRMKPRP